MTEYNFVQLVDLERIRKLLQAHHKITGVCAGILDLNQNILVAEGWEDICTCFHRMHPATHARCLESNEVITHRLHEVAGGCRASKCKNGLWDIAMPILIDGRMVATFFIGQFFYDDEEVDEAFFRAQAAQFNFDEAVYLAALRRVPIVSREQIRNLLEYYRDLIQVMAESGLQKLRLMREVEERRKAEEAQQDSKHFLEKILNSISDPIFVRDRQHRLVLVNDAECALAGRSREEMIGKTDYDFFPKEQVDVFWEKDELVFATGLENINEETITDAQGKERVIVTKKTLYQDLDGNEHIVGIIRDITERKKTAESLRFKQESLAQAQRIGRMGSWELDLVSGVLTWSDEIFNIFEIDPQKFGASYEAFLNAVHPDDRKMVDQTYTSSVQNHQPYDIDHRLLFPDGRIKYVRERCETVYDPDGKPLRSRGTVQDISEHKRADEQLALLNFALNRVGEAVYLIDGNGCFLYVNDEACRALGYSREELLALALPDIDPGYPMEQFLDIWPQLQECGSLTFEVSHRRKNGHSFPAEVNANYFEYAGNGYILALARDVTERKRTEGINLARLRLLQFAATHTLEELLQATLDEVEALTGSSIGFYHFLKADQKTLALQGRSTRTLAEFCTAEGKGMKYGLEKAGALVDCVRQRRPVVHNDYASLPHRKGRPAGNPPVVRELVVPVMRDDRIVAVLGMGNKAENYTDRDLETVSTFADLAWEIAERKQAESRLELVDFALNHVHEAAFLADEQARFHYVNNEACRSLGYRRDELYDLTIADVDSGTSLTQWAAHWQELKANGSLTFEGWHRHKDGHDFPVEISANYFEYEGQGYNLGLVRDISERKIMEDALRGKENEFRSLAENTPDTIARYDRECRRLYANPAFAALAGVSAEELLGKTPTMYSSSPAAAEFEERIREAFQSGQIDAYEYSWPDRDGRPITSHIRIVPEYDRDGVVASVLCVGRDITERKRAEELLRRQVELETRLTKLAEVSPGAIMAFQLFPDGTARISYASPRAEGLFGFRLEENADDVAKIRAAIHEDDLEAHLASIAESARTLQPWQNEFRLRHSGKGWIWIEGRSVPEPQNDDSIIWYGFLHDVTARKRRQAREEIRLRIFEGLAQGSELADILQLVVEYVELVNPDFIGTVMLADAERKYLHAVCSQGLPEGYLAAVKKVRIGDGIGSCGAAAWRGETVIASDLRTHPFWNRYKDPALKVGLQSCWSEPIFGASGTVLGTLSIYRRQPGGPNGLELDLVRHACHLAAVAVERKREQKQLLEREQTFRAVVENSPDKMARYDSEFRRIYINPAMQKTFGCSEAEILGKRPDEFSILKETEVYLRTLREAWENGREVRREITYRNAEGDIIWEDIRVVPELGPHGEVASVWAIGRDITERNRAEKALKESEERYRSLFEESIDGVFITSRQGKILDISNTGVRMFGYHSKEEMLELDLAREVYVNPGEREKVLKVVDEKGFHEYETLLTKKNGETIRARCVISSMKDAGGTIVYQGVIRDVTEQRQLEQELFKAKKLEIVGQLAGGVAHEVRNPLNALLSISEALFREKDIAENPEYRPYIHHIRTQVGRLSKLMTDLLDLGKPIKAEHIQPVSLYEVLTDTFSLWIATDPAHKDRLNFICDEQTRDLLVTVDAARLQQALLNLLDNALQHHIGNEPVFLQVGTPVGCCINIWIRDAGKGIPEAKLEKVFEPFYTTRKGGTGLGLPLVRHIVESMGGEVRLFNNEPPPGCTAELKLRIERRREKRA